MNLFPQLPDQTSANVTCQRDGSTYTVDGTPSAWGGIYKDITLEKGDYLFYQEGDMIPRARCIVDGTEYGAGTAANPVPFTLAQATETRCQITLSPKQTYENATITPHLLKI